MVLYDKNQKMRDEMTINSAQEEMKPQLPSLPSDFCRHSQYYSEHGCGYDGMSGIEIPNDISEDKETAIEELRVTLSTLVLK